MRKLLFAMLVLALASCSGVVMMSCTRVISMTTRTASCSGAVDTLDGLRRITFDLKDVAFGWSVDARILISVRSGSVNVAYRNRDGKRIDAQVYAGAPLAIEDALGLIFLKDAEITLTSTGGVATGIQYTAEFRG